MPGTDQLFAAPLRTGAAPARWGRPPPQASRHPAGAGTRPAAAAAAARDGGRHLQNGIASWYGDRFHGRRTASGERFDMHAMTAAHRTLPMRSEVRIHNPANGRSVTVRINDRGPFHAGRMIDLSYGAALRLGLLQAPAMVEMWRTGPGDEQADQDRRHRDDAGHVPAAPAGDDTKPAVVASWLWETAFPAGGAD